MRERILLAAAALLAFGGSLWAPFVFDDLVLASDPAIANPSGWIDCWRLSQTRPLTWFTFWMNWQAAGAHPWSWHAVNLALHVAIALLAFDVLRRLISDRAALFAAAIFAVHPIMTEPVAYVFARATLLAALFSLLATRSWIQERPWPAAGWFFLAMLAKEETAAVPMVLALLWRKEWRATVRTAWAAMLVTALALGLRAAWATTVVPSGGGPQAGIAPLDYLAAQGVVILRYVRLVLIPWGYAVDLDIARPAWWVALLAWLAIGALAWNSRWFLIGVILLLPSSSIFPASDLAADRRMYLPMLAFSAGLALLVDKLLGARVGRRIAIVAGLALISAYYTQMWCDPARLWREALQHAPHKTRPCIQLSRTQDARNALEVLSGCPAGDPLLATEKGRRLLELERPDLALAAFGSALAARPDDPRALNNRGVALASLGQPEAARADFERAVARDPCLFDARLNLHRLGIRGPNPPGCRYTIEQTRALAH